MRNGTLAPNFTFPTMKLPGTIYFLALTLLAGGMMQAATATKTGTGTDLTGAASGVWSGGSGTNGSPKSSDVAKWTSTSLGAGLTLGTSKSWGSITVTGALSNIAISGAGTLTLGASGINMSTSTVSFAIGNPVTLGASQSWNVNTATTLTASGAISGSGFSLTKTGSGTLALTAANTYTGSTTVSGGKLLLVSPGAVYSSGSNSTAVVTIGSGAVLEFDNWGSGSNLSFGQLDYGSARIVVNGGTLRSVAAAGTAQPRGCNIGASGGTLDSSVAGSIWTLQNLSPSYSTMTISGLMTLTGAGNGSIEKAISGTGGLTVNGAGAWTLTGVNTYTGATTIAAGELVGVSGGSCTNSTVTVATGALNGVQILTTGGQWACGSLTYNSGATYLDLDFTTVTPSATTAPLLVNGNLSLNGTLNVLVRNGSWISIGTYPLVSYTGVLSGTVPGSALALPTGLVATLVNNVAAKRIDLTVTAVGGVAPVSTWTTLVGGDAGGSWGTAANWTGGVPNAADTTADFSTLDITVNSTVANDANRWVGKLVFDDTVPSNDWVLTGSGLTLATTIGSPSIAVVRSGRTATLALGLSGSQGFTKAGSGTVTLSGGTANTLSGSILVASGILGAANGASLKNVSSPIIVATGAALSLSGGFDGNVPGTSIVLNGTGNGSIGALDGSGNLTLSGAITLNTDSKITHSWNYFILNGNISGTGAGTNLELRVTVSGQPSLSVNGNISLGSGTLTVSGVAGSASVALAGTNSLAGVAVMNNGTVCFSSTKAIGGSGTNISISPGGTAALGGTDLNPLLARVLTSGSGAIALNGASSSVALNFTNYPSLSLGSVGSSTYSGTLTPGGGNYRLGGGGGTLTVSSPLNNASAGLIVNGNGASGTVVLTGTHTYGGATIVSGGTLVVTGTLSGPVVVQSGGTLSPGPSTGIGTLTVNDSVNLGATTAFSINRANSQNADLLTANSFILGGILTVTNAGSAPLLGDSFQLLSGSMTGSFSALNLPTLTAGLMWDTSQLEVNGTLRVASDSQYVTTVGPETIVQVSANPVYYWENDSITPYLPNSTNTANITFWVDGVNYRSQGVSFDTMGPVNPQNSFLTGVAGTWDAGDWLLCVVRRSGVLYGFYHAEDYTCNDAYFWSSTGMATSIDDGASWTKQGQILGCPNPCGQDGGVEAGAVVWDHLNSRWMAWGVNASCFVSYADNAAPGTWQAWDGTGFNTWMPGSGTVGHLPSLPSSIGNCAVAWSTYLNQWVMIFQTWGSSTVQMSTSPNGIRWTSPTVLYAPAVGESTSYAHWIGSRADWIGQDALLVYMRTPPEQPGRRKDVIERWVHFGPLTTPAAISNLAAAGDGTYGTSVVLNWTATPQTDSYQVLRSTTSGSGYSTVATVATSASFPTYTDTDVNLGTTYYYVIQSVNSSGSNNSIEVNAAPAAPAANGILSVNFVGGTDTTNTLMDPGEVAGVMAAPNWNNAAGASGTLSNLTFAAGASSAATVSWSSPNTYSTGIPDAPGDYRMMEYYLDGSSPSVTVTNIPDAFANSGYDVYVYCDGNSTSGRTGKYTISGSSIQAIDSANFTFNYIEANNSAGNYVVFRGLKTKQFTLNCQGVGTGTLRAPVNGIQLVAPALLPYGSWAVSYALPTAQSGFSADADGDGVPNGIEWLLGSNPLASNATVLPKATVVAGSLQLTFSRNPAAVSSTVIVVQWSTDLFHNWHDVPVGSSSSGPDANGAIVTVTPNGVAAPDSVSVAVPLSNAPAGKMFLRLELTQP